MASNRDDIAGLREQIKENATFIYPDQEISLLVLHNGRGYVAVLVCKAKAEDGEGTQIAAKSGLEAEPCDALQGLLRILGSVALTGIVLGEVEIENSTGFVKVFNGEATSLGVRGM